MQYLAQWRMQVAGRLLLETRANVAAIALEVGYDSEAAFNRAFRRIVGIPPARWRQAKVSAQSIECAELSQRNPHAAQQRSRSNGPELHGHA